MNGKNLLRGWICFNKPGGISSNMVMLKVKKIFGERCGYVGTLDPFATGVLPIAVGECRKFIPYIEDTIKIYSFTVVFGKTTDTLDKYGKITDESPVLITPTAIKNIIPEFVGKILQMPPLYSAIKISGRRACDLVREGKDVTLSGRIVEIFSLKLMEFLPPNRAVFVAECARGTYVRSLARDIAQKLNTIAYVEQLTRLRAGFFSINNSFTLENLEKMRDTKQLAATLINMESPLDDIPALPVTEDQAAKLRSGLIIQINSSQYSSNVRLFKETSHEFIGIGSILSDGSLKAVRICSYD